MPINLDLLDRFPAERVVAQQSTASTSIINEYKLEFTKKRIWTTITGGTKLPDDAPWFFHLIQAAIAIAPWLPAGLCTLLVELDVITLLDGVLLTGGLSFAIMAVLLLIRRLRARHMGLDDTMLHSLVEDEADFVSCADPETYLHALATGSVSEDIVRCIMAGVTMAMLTWTLRPGMLSQLMSVPATVAIMLFGSITAIIGVHPLVVGACPEPFPYQPVQPRRDWDILSRPVHIVILLTIFQAIAPISASSMAQTALLIVMAMLPIVWMLSWLPPLTAIADWSLEQYQTLLLGGSANHTQRSALIAASAGTVAVAILYAIVNPEVDKHDTRNMTTFISIASFFGYVLALDWAAIPSALQSTSLMPSSKVAPLISAPSSLKRSKALSAYQLVQLLIALIVSIVVPTLVLHCHNSQALSSSDATQTALDIVAWLHWTTIMACRCLQAPLVANMVRNPVYKARQLQEQQQVFSLGTVHRALMLLAPLTSIMFLSYRLSCCGSTAPFWVAAATFRAFRMAWREADRSLLQLAVVGALQRMTASDSTWQTTPLVIQLLLVGFVHLRWRVFVKQIRFVMVTVITSWSIKPMRVPATKRLLAVNLVLLPFTITLIAACAIIGGTILPLFGLPFFCLAAPRPKRFWPTVGGSSPHPQAEYYRHATPALHAMIAQALVNGRLGSCQVGDMFLLRFENRMVVVEVVEMHYASLALLVKGLELTETSCHTTEATHLEHSLDWTFTTNELGIYPHLTDSFVPVVAEQITTLTDTRNQLTGMIDNPEVLKLVQDCFQRSLAWRLAQAEPCLTEMQAWKEFASTHGEQIDTQCVADWISYLQGHTDAWSTATRPSTTASRISRQGLDLSPHTISTLSGLCSRAVFTRVTATRLAQLFIGRLPSDFSAMQPPQSLIEVVVTAARLACKLGLDMAILGEVQVTSSEDCLSDLQDLHDNWHLGPSEDSAWFECVRHRTKPSLFSMQGQDGFVSSHLVTTRPVDVRGVRLNDEAVRGQWSNLVFELLYLTNDDEERYSIQAHAPLLRNLTLQMAEPPLGYHLYANIDRVWA